MIIHQLKYFSAAVAAVIDVWVTFHFVFPGDQSDCTAELCEVDTAAVTLQVRCWAAFSTSADCEPDVSAAAQRDKPRCRQRYEVCAGICNPLQQDEGLF